MIVGVIDSYAGSAAATGAARLKCSVSAERAESDIVDGFVRACEEHEEDRQRAVELLRLQIDLHVFGNEETEAQRGRHRLFKIVQRCAQIRHSQRIGRRSHRFLAAKDIN